MKKNNMLLVMIITIFTKNYALQASESTLEYNPTIESFEYQPNVIADTQKQYPQTNQDIQEFKPNIQKLQPILQPIIVLNSLNPSHQLMKVHLQKKYNNHDVLDSKNILPSFDEFHIDTDFITDQNIVAFVNKFKNETTTFQLKLSEIWAKISREYDTLEHQSQKIRNADLNKPVIISRDQAIIQLKTIIEKVFDPNDKKSLSSYISEMKAIAQHLDTDKDEKIIQSIDFLQKNQHRTSIFDYIFWNNYAQTINPEDFHAILEAASFTQIPLITQINTLQNKVNASKAK